MENVLNTLESKLSPESLSAPAPKALAVGKTTHALTLFETFGNEDNEQTKVKVLQRLACEDHLTYSEFSEACKKACEQADAKDKLCGFQPAPDAKGVDKYGPTRKVLNQRLSEAKQVFGVFKLNPDVLKERGYWNALALAREYLKEAGIKWNLTKVEAPEVKQAKAQQRISNEVREETMSMWPQQAGESFKAYVDRIADKMDKAMEAKQQEVFNEKINKLVEKLAEQYNEHFLIAVADRILAKFDTLAHETAEMIPETQDQQT